MSNTPILLQRNTQFVCNFSNAELPILPKLRMVIVTCGDARVDPAHVLGLDLGEAVVIRNNGGRVTQAVIDELATLAFMVARMDGDNPGPFEVVIMQHTQCGAERFADSGFRNVLKEHLGVDVSGSAIVDHKQSLSEDVERLRNSPKIPGYVVASGLLYDVKDGSVSELIAPAVLAA